MQAVETKQRLFETPPSFARTSIAAKNHLQQPLLLGQALTRCVQPPILKNQSPKYSEEWRLLPKMEADFFVHLFVTQNTYWFSANCQKMFIGFCGTSECFKSLFELTLRGPWIRNTTLGFNDHYTFYNNLYYLMRLSKMANKCSENHNLRNVKWYVS